MQFCHLKATTIGDAWFQLVYTLMKGEAPHSVYTIDKGSYVGQKRLEYDYVTVQIDHPGQRPLIPDIPPGLGIPAPVESMEYVNDYFFNYLMDPELAENETYRYSTWINPGIERVIEQLRNSPGNNQAAISIGGWAPSGDMLKIPSASIYDEIDVPYATCGMSNTFVSPSDVSVFASDTDNLIDPGTGQRDPACLRLIDFRFDQSHKLHMVVYFRSWDLWGGFPANLAGLQLLKEYVCDAIEAEDGCIIASSKGLHLYDHAIQIAATRLGMNDVGSMDDLLNYIEMTNRNV
jgi:thymidylate synthase